MIITDGDILTFRENNTIVGGQDRHRFEGVPAEVEFAVGLFNSDREEFTLTGHGYGLLNRGTGSYGNGKLYVTLGNLLSNKNYITVVGSYPSEEQALKKLNIPKNKRGFNMSKKGTNIKREEPKMISFKADLASEIKDYDFNSHDFQNLLLTIEERCSALMKAKDADYGGSWQKDGIFSAHYNTKRKWDRLHNLFLNGYSSEFEDETTLDTLMDLRNYVTLYMAYMVSKDSNLFAILTED